MIDIHSHLLPGVDDGSPSLAVSIPVIERFVQQGVTVLVCTPHLNASRVALAPVAHHQELLTALRAASPHGLDIRLGWEIMLDTPGVDLTSTALCLGDSRALLVEFTRGGLPPGASQELRRICRAGRTPVLAHPERYFGCTLDAVRAWRALGVVIQTDASVLMGRGTPADLARSMLAEGLIDVLASDNHGDHRSLGDAREWLLEHHADEQLDLLLNVNAHRVLSDEDPLPVPPLATSLIGRLKRLFGR